MPGGLALTYNPNGFGEARQASVPGYNYASGVTYHPNGAIKQMSFGNTRGYDSQQNDRQQTSRIHYWYGFIHHLSYDKNGRLTTLDDQYDNSRDRTFTYDDLGRLKTASGEWGAGSYNYDNRNNLTRKQLGSRVVEIEYNGQNRVSRARDSASGNVWQNYAYDSRGNVTDNGPINFIYDHAMQPSSISGSDSGTFKYDGLFKRVKQTINSETIYSVYGANGQLMHRDNATTSQTTDYVRLGGMLIAEKTAGISTYLYQDHLGSPIMGAESPSVTWNERYTPYGEKWASASQGDDNVGFTGHVTDTDTGLTYMQARYYDPLIGRFLSVDPVGFTEGGPMYHNRYAYAGNDPINAIDPSGTQYDPVTSAKEAEQESIAMGDETALSSAMSAGMQGSETSLYSGVGQSIPAPISNMCESACSLANDVASGMSSVPGINTLASTPGIKTVAAGVEANAVGLVGPSMQSGVYSTTDGSQAGVVNVMAGAAGFDVSAGGFIAGSTGVPPTGGGFGEMSVFASLGGGPVTFTVDAGTKSGAVTGVISGTHGPIPVSAKGGVAVAHFSPCNCK